MKKLSFILFQLLFVLSVFAQDAVRYTSANLRMRTDTTVTSPIVAVIPAGTALSLSESCDCNWILVSYQGKTGYVSSKYLSKEQPVATGSSPIKYYINSAGEKVQSPTHYNSVPQGATALCRDGTYSFSRSRRGTCSHHGGVAKWL